MNKIPMEGENPDMHTKCAYAGCEIRFGELYSFGEPESAHGKVFLQLYHTCLFCMKHTGELTDLVCGEAQIEDAE